MEATLENAERIVDKLALPNDSVDKTQWKVYEEGNKVVAENVYHIVDRHGHYNVKRGFRLIWDDEDMLDFKLEFDVPQRDEGLAGLSDYLKKTVIDKTLDQYFIDSKDVSQAAA